METLVLPYRKKRLRHLWKHRDETSEAWRKVHFEEFHNVECCSGIIEAISLQICFNYYQFNAQFLYSITINMLPYNPRHVSSITMLIFRR